MDYVRFEDFQKLCSADQRDDFKQFLWTQFQLHRLVGTLDMAYNLFETDQEANCEKKEFQAQEFLDTILENV